MKDLENSPSPESTHPGSVKSYVTGFVISLILTIIPYLLVRTQAAAATSLLLAILGLAAVQMFVQIFFFLHLGRGPKPFYNVIFFIATSGMILLVVGASIIIMNNLYRNMSPSEVTTRLAQDENIDELGGKPTGACQGNGENHSVTIGSERVDPQVIKAERCDTLSIKSDDGKSYMIMFGTFDNPTSYGGLDAVTVRSDRSKVITLNEIGTYTYHDHANRSIEGVFTVEP